MAQNTKAIRVVIGGSRVADPRAANLVLEELVAISAELSRDIVVVMRRGKELASAGPFEAKAAEYCRRWNIPIEWRVPSPGGRAEVFHRDIDMMVGADLVVCVFAQDTIMSGGTGHLVEKAIDQGVPAYAYCYDGHVLDRVGEFDPQNTWGDYLPA